MFTAPITGQVRAPRPTPMEDKDSITTTSSSRVPACVSGGRASGGGGRRPFPSAPNGTNVLAAPGAAAAGALNDKALASSDFGATKPHPRRAQRGLPLVQWVWPANSGSAIARAGSEWFRGATGGGAGREEEVAQEDNSLRLQRRTPKSSVVVGTVCEPVRPTRLDLSAAEGYPTSSRVIYTARGGHANPGDAHPSSTAGTHKAPTTTTSTRPPALKLPLPLPQDVPWLDSAGLGLDTGGGGFGGCGGGGGGGTRGRAYSANSAGAAGLQSPRYLQSTTVSQAKAVEPSGRNRSEKQRSSSTRVSGGGGGARRGRGMASLGGGDSDVGYGGSGSGVGGGGFGGPAGMLESLGGFLGIGKGAGAAGGGGAVAGAGGKDASRWGKGRRQSRNTASRGSTGSGRMGSKVLKRLRKSTEGKHSRYGSVKVKAPPGGPDRAAAAAQADEVAHQHPRVMRRDERLILTMHTHGVLRPEGVKLRVVKASGRTLEDTKFHMEIRTQRPGQVWSVCRGHKDFQNLHSCLQGRFPALVLPRLPRPPTGGGIVLEPATLERARAGLQAYIGAVVASVPAAWGVEEFVMFLDSDEKGRRLFSRKRKQETRRVVELPSPAVEIHQEDENEDQDRDEEEAQQREQQQEQQQEEEHKPAPRKAAFPSDLVSPRVGVTGDGFHKKSLLDLKVEEKKLALEALEGAAANHFDGVGAVMNTAVSFSDDSDDSEVFEEGGDFIDGEDAIRAMLDRDADEAEDDNLFSIPAGTDFGIPLDDDDDDDIGDGFDITYHG